MHDLTVSAENTPENMKELAVINLAAALNIIEMSYDEDGSEMAFLDAFLDRVKAYTPEELMKTAEGFGAYNQRALIVNYLAENDPSTIMGLIQQSLLMTQGFILSWEMNENTDEEIPEDKIIDSFEFSMGTVIITGGLS